MAKYPVADIRNIAFCGHGSAGKTTLVDRLLVAAGAFNRPASVDEGTSICDFDDEEKQHKYSIEATVVHFDHGGKHFQVIDTPGYPDFIGQTIGALRAVDTAAVVDQRPVGHRGEHAAGLRRGEEGRPGPPRSCSTRWTPRTSTSPPCWRASRSCSARPACCSTCRWARGPISAAWPARSSVPADTAGALVDPAEVSQSLLESIIEVDEAVMERYFEGTPPTAEELPRLDPAGRWPRGR